MKKKTLKITKKKLVLKKKPMYQKTKGSKYV